MIGAASSSAIRSRYVLPARSSKSARTNGRLPLALLPGPERSSSPSGRATNSARSSRLPALASLDARDRPVGDLVVEAVVDGDELLRSRGARG